VGVNLILWLFFPNVFWFWWNAIGRSSTVKRGCDVGLAAVRSTARSEPGGRAAARSFPLRESVVMLIVFICILVFCILLPRAASADICGIH